MNDNDEYFDSLEGDGDGDFYEEEEYDEPCSEDHRYFR